jgi:hypothetical protein
VIQRSGDLIFVPSGWYHQVHNLEPTVSINHNWINAACLPALGRFMCDEARSVVESIQHLRASAVVDASNGGGSADLMDRASWRAHCALLMRLNCGMDLDAVLDMIRLGCAPCTAVDEIATASASSGDEEIAAYERAQTVRLLRMLLGCSAIAEICGKCRWVDPSAAMCDGGATTCWTCRARNLLSLVSQVK